MMRSMGRVIEDPLSTLRRLHARHGDVVHLRLPFRDALLINHPDLVEEVLLRNASQFRKDILLREVKILLGDGLLTSEDSFWRRQRKLASPFLVRRQIEKYAKDMIRMATSFSESLVDGEEIDIHRRATALTLDIVSLTLFGTDGDDRVAEQVERCLDVTMDYFFRVTRSWRRVLPRWLPTAQNRRTAAAIEELDSIVYRIIADRRRSGANGDDLLSRLISAMDEDGRQMNDQQVRDEVITMFLAGHETTAIAFANTLWLLSQNPDAAAPLYDEIDSLGEPLNPRDVDALPYTNAVLTEALRLQPPAWSVAREATTDTTIGEYAVPRGMQVYLSQYLIQRDPRFYPDPLRFDPSRWLDDHPEPLPRFAYFPFGGGPRVCIGNHFALMELKLMLVCTLRRARLVHREGHEVRYLPSVTLRPITPMPMRVHIPSRP